MECTAFAVANYFLRLGRFSGEDIEDRLKIGNLVPGCTGMGPSQLLHAIDNPPDGLPLAHDEFDEAWQFGAQ